MSAEEIVYFGYGSLVNRETRPPEEPAARARLRGWHRVWGHRVVRGRGNASCSLSVEPNAPAHVLAGEGGEAARGDAPSGEAGIDGVVVRLPLEALPVLDEREGGYDRLTLPASHFDLPEGLGADEVHVYRSKLENRLPAAPAQPILQTYVDCVMAGYLRLYGEGGLDAFMLSTRGWDGAIENDRERPRYVRAVEVPGGPARPLRSPDRGTARSLRRVAPPDAPPDDPRPTRRPAR